MKLTILLDSFLVRVFSLAKLFSAFVVFLGLVVAIITGAILVFAGGSSIEKPDFDVIIHQYEIEKSGSDQVEQGDYKTLEEKRALEKAYGDDLQELIIEYKMQSVIYDVVIESACAIDKDYQSDYFSGLEDFIDDAVTYSKKNKDKDFVGAGQAVMLYTQLFSQSLQQAEFDKMESAGVRSELFVVFACALAALLAFLFLPLLISIEQNTREESNSNE